MLVPTTAYGRVCLVVFVAFLGLMGLFSILVASGQRGGEEFFDNLWLTVPVLAAFFCVVVAFIAGTAAILAQGERSIPVIIASIVALAVTIFGVLEVAFPH